MFEVGSYKWCAPARGAWRRAAPARPPRRPALRAEGHARHAGRYILVYPQGCDVCNHLSLFLCVADYDKLLPGAPAPPPRRAAARAAAGG